jgi:hypothetical protein
MNWQPIETAPTEDGVPHVRGVWIYNADTGNPLYFDMCAGYLEDGCFVVPCGDDYGLHPDDYTHWVPLPKAPEE